MYKLHQNILNEENKLTNQNNEISKTTPREIVFKNYKSSFTYDDIDYIEEVVKKFK